MNIEKLKKILNEPLIKNSYYIVFNSSSVYLLGFIFWFLAARYYSVETVGVATAILSLVQLIYVFSSLGLNYSLIRFLPKSIHKNSLVNSSINLNLVITIIITIICIILIEFWSTSLSFLKENYLFLITFFALTLTFSLFSLQNSIFIAFRESKLAFFQSLLFNLLKIPLVMLLIIIGLVGLLYSWIIPGIISYFIGILRIKNILKDYHFELSIKAIDKEILVYSFGNYISNILMSLQVMVMPLIIINLWGADLAAYFYISWSISAPLSFLSSAVSTSLLVEGSHEIGNFKSNLVKAIKLIFVLLIPGIILIFIFGNYILLLFGTQYSENALGLLYLLTVATIPLSINHIYMTVKRVEKKMINVIFVNLYLSLAMIGGSYLIFGLIGLNGIGVSWLIGNSIIAIILLIKLKKEARST
jgi:O-antigen/teichoic acid export membrane protein